MERGAALQRVGPGLDQVARTQRPSAADEIADGAGDGEEFGERVRRVEAAVAREGDLDLRSSVGDPQIGQRLVGDPLLELGLLRVIGCVGERENVKRPHDQVAQPNRHRNGVRSPQGDRRRVSFFTTARAAHSAPALR